ncbi:uncharacterized protein LOC126904834 [Daktulosphaira vitifoliae]|uniref:uncharacterized protein LOC126904834 n=1 Tax=Daktulosphaira vitifoliae TaxID=58002 RepID=UPI0021A9E937|nr:uncharacterized protein LOC126904834 [Daktulosphaira vitifoliae]
MNFYKFNVFFIVLLLNCMDTLAGKSSRETNTSTNKFQIPLINEAIKYIEKNRNGFNEAEKEAVNKLINKYGKTTNELDTDTDVDLSRLYELLNDARESLVKLYYEEVDNENSDTKFSNVGTALNYYEGTKDIFNCVKSDVAVNLIKNYGKNNFRRDSVMDMMSIGYYKSCGMNPYDCVI